jgi:hypothetical protein
LPTLDNAAITQKMSKKDFSFIVSRDLPGQDGQRAVYFYARTLSSVPLLVELKFKAGMNVCKVSVRANSKTISEACKVSVAKILLATDL